MSNTIVQQIRWSELADSILAGNDLSRDEAEALLQSSDPELLEVMAAAYKVRYHHFGNKVQLYFLMNAKSGLCPENCSYCSQSKVSEAPIPKYNILSADKLLDGARMAAELDSRPIAL